MKKTSSIFLTLVSSLSLHLAKAQEPYPEDTSVPDTLREEYTPPVYYYNNYYGGYYHPFGYVFFHGYWGHWFHPYYAYYGHCAPGYAGGPERGNYYGPRNIRGMATNGANGRTVPSTGLRPRGNTVTTGSAKRGNPSSAGPAPVGRGNSSSARGGFGSTGGHSASRGASS